MRERPPLSSFPILTSDSIIGQDTTLSIKVGAEAGVQDAEDIIVLRGVSAEVDRAVKDILQIVEAAKNDRIVNNYVRHKF
jgi:hypothetical protein